LECATAALLVWVVVCLHVSIFLLEGERVVLHARCTV
jgi:hypothetical protein